MSRLDNLHNLTVELYELLQGEITSDNREKIIKEINVLIEQREELMQNITPPFSKTENKLGKKVIIMNKEIESKLEHVFSQLKTEMKQVQKQKKSNRTYINPYGPIQTIDGMYVDSKK